MPSQPPKNVVCNGSFRRECNKTCHKCTVEISRSRVVLCGVNFVSECLPQLPITEIAKLPLHFIFSYVQPVTNEEH